MGISIRTMLTTGVCGVTASAIILAPSTAQPRASFAPAFSYTAYSLGPPNAHTEITSETMREAVKFIESIGPSPARGSSTIATPGVTGFTAPAIASIDGGDRVDVQNTASGVIDSVYSFTRYWANYMALDLGPWLINWIPFGYLISDQINIWYNAFVLPVVDSFVYKFLDPIVNDPLNAGVWWNGVVAIADAALKGVGAGIAGEINYVFSLGWLPFPLPPLPGLASPGTAADTADPALRMSLAAASGDLTSTPTTASAPAPQNPTGTTPESTEPAPPDPQTEAPGAGSTDSTTDPTPTATSTPETTAPTPDNSGPTTPTSTPTSTPTPSTDPTDDPSAPDDDGTVTGNPGTDSPGTEDPSTGTGPGDTGTDDTPTGTDPNTGSGSDTSDTGQAPAGGGSSQAPGTDAPHSADPGTSSSDPGKSAGIGS